MARCNNKVTANRIRANFTSQTVRVYQAYSPAIASPALRAGRFVPPFKTDRMTWIKPSFNWMMYRSGYASKPGQETILAIDISRKGFDWALQNAVLTSFEPQCHESHEAWRKDLALRPGRVQWDPERDWMLRPIGSLRTIQIGLGPIAVQRYASQWIVRIEDVTEKARECGAARGCPCPAPPIDLPSLAERDYPVEASVATRILCTP